MWTLIVVVVITSSVPSVTTFQMDNILTKEKCEALAFKQNNIKAENTLVKTWCIEEK